MDEKWQQLKDWINEKRQHRIFWRSRCFYGKRHTGFPRSVDGLYNQKYKYPPEQSSVTAFTYKIRKSSTATKDRMLFQMQNLIKPSRKPFANWNRKEN